MSSEFRLPVTLPTKKNPSFLLARRPHGPYNQSKLGSNKASRARPCVRDPFTVLSELLVITLGRLQTEHYAVKLQGFACVGSEHSRCSFRCAG